MATGAFAPLPLRLGGSPEDGVTAAQFARLSNDLAAARRVAPFARMVIDPNGGAPLLLHYRGQNGVGTADRPVLSYASNRVVVTFATSYPDDLGVVSRVNIVAARGATSSAVGGAAGFVLVDDITQRHVVRAIGTDISGAITTTRKFSLIVWSR